MLPPERAVCPLPPRPEVLPWPPPSPWGGAPTTSLAGLAGGFGEAVPVDEAKSVTEALVGAAKRVEMNWAVATDRLPKGAVKVLLNFAQIGLDAQRQAPFVGELFHQGQVIA